MKIAIVSKNDLTNDYIPRKFAYSLVDSDQKYECLLIGVADLDTTQTLVISSMKLKQQEISLGTRRWSKRLNFIRLPLLIVELQLKFLLTLFRFKPDLIYAFNYVTLLAGATYKLAHKKTKLVYHARELESQQSTNRLLNFIILKIERSSRFFIDYIVTPSDSITKWYNDKLNVKAISIYNSPIVDDNFQLEKNYFHMKFGIPIKEKLFVHSGALCEGRNIDLLVKIFAENDLGRLIFIGPITSKKYEYIEKNKIRNVYYHSSVKHEFLVSYLATANVGLIMFDNEVLNREWALPNKFFEYANANLPIISSNFNDMANLIMKYDLGLSIKPSKECFINAIRQMKEQTNEFYKEVPLELTWEFQERNFLRLINELLIEGVNK